MKSTSNGPPIVLINEDAGSMEHVAKDQWTAALTERLQDQGLNVRLEIAPSVQISGRLRQAVSRRPPALIVGGGDGTILSAVSAIGDRDIPLGIIPMGTFNSLARDLGIPAQWEAAADIITRGRIREIDVAEVNGRPFMSLCIIGFLATPECSKGQGIPWWWKAVRNLRLSVTSYVRYPLLRLSVNTDQVSGCIETRLAAVANNSFRDETGLNVPQRNELDAGKLTIYLSQHSTRLEVMKACLAFLLGRLSEDPNLTMLTATTAAIQIRRRRHVRISLDGEVIRESLPLLFSIHPRQLKVFSSLEGGTQPKQA